jgi:two-component system, cell cycle response regulator
MSAESRDVDPDQTELFAPESVRAGDSERKPCLIVLSGRDVGRIFVLASDEAIVGRAPGVQVRLTDHGLSRQHARIFRVGPELIIEDLQSSNGTLLNDAPISRASLSDGDRIRLGPTTLLSFTYQESGEARFQKNLVDTAERDPLTGAYTRHYLLGRLTRELAYAQRHGTPLVLCRVSVNGIPDTDRERVAALVCDALRPRLGEDDVLTRTRPLTFVALSRRSMPLDLTSLADELGRLVAPGRVNVRLHTADRSTASAGELLIAAERER